MPVYFVRFWLGKRRPPASRSGEDAVSIQPDEPEWLRPIDLMVDSYAPEQIADRARPRHALYLREAQRLVLEGSSPTRGEWRPVSGPRRAAT